MSVEKLLDLEHLLNLAEREYLRSGKLEFHFPVRRKSGVEDYYLRLEKEINEQSVVSVSDYRKVKEGYAHISRPARLKISVASLLACRPHLSALSHEIAFWRSSFGELLPDDLLGQAFGEAMRDPSLTRSCFEVLLYLVRNRSEVRGLLPRQVPHAQSSKLIGREALLLRMFGVWRKEPATWSTFFRYFELLRRPLEFRFYSPDCDCSRATLADFHGVLTQDSKSRYDFSRNKGTLIVENIETFYAEASRSSDWLIVWGGGWKATWLRSLEEIFPRPILYWGDIDKEGFEIYGHLKKMISDLEPTRMDRVTLDKHRDCVVAKEPFYGPFQQIEGLQMLYQDVCTRGLCLEQEKVHEHPYLKS